MSIPIKLISNTLKKLHKSFCQKKFLTKKWSKYLAFSRTFLTMYKSFRFKTYLVWPFFLLFPWIRNQYHILWFMTPMCAKKNWLAIFSTFCKLSSKTRTKRSKKWKTYFKCVLEYIFIINFRSRRTHFVKKVKIVLPSSFTK